MAPQADPVDVDSEENDEQPRPTITAHETVPGRLVFTEGGNTDGWISTDLTIDLEP